MAVPHTFRLLFTTSSYQRNTIRLFARLPIEWKCRLVLRRGEVAPALHWWKKGMRDGVKSIKDQPFTVTVLLHWLLPASLDATQT